VEQEIILVETHFPEWRPNLKEKIPETEFIKIMDGIREKRLEYFQNDTGKYRDEVMKRDSYKCSSCGTDGLTEYKRKNGMLMKNPLQIHHLDYYKDSPDSLLTLCLVCHYTLHRRLYIKTGAWSTKNKVMKLDKEDKIT
jgi:predicted HNH restriction endonuclease